MPAAPNAPTRAANAQAAAHRAIMPAEEVRVILGAQMIEFVWPEFGTFRLGFAELRKNCCCAQCTALRRQGKEIDAGDDIAIVAVNAIGASGLQFVFSDGHDRGIFPWRYIFALAQGLAPSAAS